MKTLRGIGLWLALTGCAIIAATCATIGVAIVLIFVLIVVAAEIALHAIVVVLAAIGVIGLAILAVPGVPAGGVVYRRYLKAERELEAESTPGRLANAERN